MKDHNTDKRDEFWDALEDVVGAMLGLTDGAMIPMSPKVRSKAKDGFVWFVTSKDNELFKGVASGSKPARLVVADRSEGIWADVEGTLDAHTDDDVLNELWGVTAAAWFDDGKNDPDARLMRFKPHSAEATLTDDNPVKFFYEIAKAAMSDDTPDLNGWKGKITF